MSKASESDKPTHPWSELSLRDDKIIHGKAPKPETEYLSTPEVGITGKKEVVVDVEGGRTSYAFQLNTSPDPGWRHFFDKNLEDLPDKINRSDLRVAFEDDTLILLCMPSKLEAKYAFVKDTIARTNRAYYEEKEAVRRRLAESAARMKQDAAAGKNKIEMVKERFDKLEL